MNKYLNITNSNYYSSSYIRNTYKHDKIYDFYIHKEYFVFITKALIYVQDNYALNLLRQNKLDLDTFDKYNQEINIYFKDFEKLDDMGIEEIYEELRSISNKYFKHEEIDDSSINGLNQEDIFFNKLEDVNSVLMILEDKDEYLLYEKYKKLINKDIYTLTYDSNSMNLNKIAFNEKLQKDIDNNKTLLMVFGESGYLLCRDLKIDSFIIAKANSYYSSALVNNIKGKNFIYVPKDFNIQNYISLINKSRLTYSQLFYLYKTYIGINVNIYMYPFTFFYMNYNVQYLTYEYI